MLILLSNLEYNHWIETIVSNMNVLIDENETINIIIQTESTEELFKPFHYVLLKCYIHHLQNKNIHGHLKIESQSILNDAKQNIKFDKYISDSDQFYISASDEKIFNLFRVQDDKKESYSRQITNYLNNYFFKNKDLSAVQNAILEAYHNISDHANANGNAYSFIKYDSIKMKLHIAVCDFGNGIAAPIRQIFPSIITDEEAIRKAIEVGFTIQSKKHNKGFGLDNIISSLTKDDELQIYTNSVCLIVKNKEISTFALNFNFKGTVLFFELSINTYEDLEMNDLFTFE